MLQISRQELASYVRVDAAEANFQYLLQGGTNVSVLLLRAFRNIGDSHTNFTIPNYLQTESLGGGAVPLAAETKPKFCWYKSEQFR